ncbi:uncharacterized protein CEXT_616451 [Caerostris extrusa]|uniref:Uncharacterized protein n=1 Tax=Caerostris extrusa TaxID=172846 RepID=A0AAV4SV75_CAEEX|nr:uncharacterized protein CEXT_616451 [Caerostris extrusa]
MQMKDPETENCCFLYAHWQNADSPPMINHPPGGNVIGKYKQFVIRDFDNKWCYETEGFKFMKKTKSRQRKHALNDLEDDFYFDCYE